MTSNLDMRLIEVKGNLTGNVKSFTTTRAGFYSLAKFALANTEFYNQELSVYDIMGYLCEVTHLDDVGVKREWFPMIFTNIWRFFVDITIINCVRVCGTLYRKDEMFRVGNSYFPKSWKQYTKRCVECNEVFFDCASTPRNILDNVDTSLYGFDEECGSCALSNNSSLRRCYECGIIFDSDAEGAYVDSVDDYVCDDCLSEGYGRCEHCGEYFRYDDGDYVDTGDYVYCCWDCAEADGWRYSESREEWVPEDEYENEIDNIISDYHDHKGCLDAFYGNKSDNRVKQRLFVGTEIEVDGADRDDFDRDWYDELLSKFGNHVVLENDGSLDRGFEIITCPMTENAAKSFDWRPAYKHLVDAGFRSHDTSTCGQHYHYSEGYLGYNRRERENNAKKVCKFFQLYWNDIAKISRRNDFGYCHDWDYEISKNTDFDKLKDTRYHAVNLQNMGKGIRTIEIRICKGTLNVETTLASRDFFLHIVRNAKRIAWKNIDNLKLWFKGIKDKNTINYIKERHAFESAF